MIYYRTLIVFISMLPMYFVVQSDDLQFKKHMLLSYIEHLRYVSNSFFVQNSFCEPKEKRVHVVMHSPSVGDGRTFSNFPENSRGYSDGHHRITIMVPPTQPPPKYTFDENEKNELLRLHNMYRSNSTPPAADMKIMVWDEELAEIAQMWSKKCIWQHFMPENTYGEGIGQNLYRGPDPMESVAAFYEEINYYTFETQECLPEKACGHYTQVMWAETEKVGCGINTCSDNKYYVACHYFPAGNIMGIPPYQVGAPCSQCEKKGSLCMENLCIAKEQCEKEPKKCEDAECNLHCHNCGKLDKTKCECTCRNGWDSLDCSVPCENSHPLCGKNPGIPSKEFCYSRGDTIAEIHCRKMCETCKSITDKDKLADLCCEGKLCEKGYVLDKSCECVLLCPGPLCLSKDGKTENKHH